MSKAEIYERVSDYIDGNMSDEQIKSFELEMNKNHVLQREVDDIKNLIKNIKSVKKVELPYEFDSKLKDAIDNNISGFSVFRVFNNPVWVTAGSVAATILLVVTVSLFFSKSQTHGLISDEDQIAFEEEKSFKDIEINLHQAKTKKMENLENLE